MTVVGWFAQGAPAHAPAGRLQLCVSAVCLELEGDFNGIFDRGFFRVHACGARPEGLGA